MEQPTVLVLSADAEFARGVLERWQTERTVPAFALMSNRALNGTATAAFDLAVAGPVEDGSDPLLSALEQTGKPVICICANSVAAQKLREKLPRVLVLQRYEGCLDALVVLGGECLRRVEAVRRAQQAEQAIAASQRQATLGRYMLEMRHSLTTPSPPSWAIRNCCCSSRESFPRPCASRSKSFAT